MAGGVCYYCSVFFAFLTSYAISSPFGGNCIYLNSLAGTQRSNNKLNCSLVWCERSCRVEDLRICNELWKGVEKGEKRVSTNRYPFMCKIKKPLQLVNKNKLLWLVLTQQGQTILRIKGKKVEIFTIQKSVTFKGIHLPNVVLRISLILVYVTYACSITTPSRTLMISYGSLKSIVLEVFKLSPKSSTELGKNFNVRS